MTSLSFDGESCQVLCIGEPLATLSVAGWIDGAPSTSARLSIGGAELNVAIYLARVGFAVRFAARVGDDVFGHKIVELLRSERIDCSLLEVDAERNTGLYVKQHADVAGTSRSTLFAQPLYYRRNSAASHMGELDSSAFDNVDHVHLSGITAALSPSCAKLCDAVLSSSTPVSFDVNYRASLWPSGGAPDHLLGLARRSRIVFVGLDEATALWGVTTADEVRGLLGDVELVVKDGAGPAIAYSDGRVEVEAALPVEVVEATGAGDAFAAGYLAARLSGRSVAVGLRMGHAVATSSLRVREDFGPIDAELLAVAVAGEG